jgi:beta-galactosidase
MGTRFAVSPSTQVALVQQISNLALDEGLVPFWYGIAGWEPITAPLLAQLGMPIPPDLNAASAQQQIQSDPRMQAYQTGVLRRRVAALGAMPASGCAFGEPGRDALPLANSSIEAFAAWLQATYATVEALQLAWQYPYGNISQQEFTTFAEAATLLASPDLSEDFRRYRDARRFIADSYVQRTHRTFLAHMRKRGSAASHARRGCPS